MIGTPSKGVYLDGKNWELIGLNPNCCASY